MPNLNLAEAFPRLGIPISNGVKPPRLRMAFYLTSPEWVVRLASLI